MPPRRSTRAASTATEAPPAPTRSTRARKVVPASPTPEAEADSDDEAPIAKKAPAKRTSAAKAKTPAPASKRRSARAATAASPTPEPQVKAEPEAEPESAPTSPEKPVPKAAKAKRRVVESSDSEEDLEDLIPAPAKSVSPQASSPGGAEVDDAPTPTPDGPQEPTAREGSATPVPVTPKKQTNSDPISPDSSPDMAHVLPPKTPARGAAPRPTLMATPAPPPPAAGPKPRLVIHKLVLVNFKSYAGRQEIGPFHKSFSSIVGPNGSGKSNTIDALLFVFGYRASKMRQGKLSELIHNSAGKEGLESCSVEVWFREIVDLPGVDDFLLVPNSQLVVNRTAFRNNSSRYTINDRNSTFTEVTTLLKGKGIDLDHNRFLILQGEVESIALMKAKAGNEHEDGLLEYLEDIIGTTKYKEPIEQASLEVEGLSEERGEKMNRLRVVEREKASLEDKKREAESFLRDTNDLTRKKSLLWQYHMYTLQNNIELTTKAIDSLTAELSEEQERNAHHLAQIEDLQKDHDEKLATFGEVKRLTDALVKDTKRIEKEEVALQEKKKHLSTKQKKLKKSIQDDSHAKSEAHVTAENCAGEIESNRTKVAELEKKLEVEEAELEEVRDSLKDKTDEFTIKIEAKQRELEPWTAKISEKQSAIDVAQSERDLLAGKATTAQAALEEARTALKDVEQGASAKQEEYKALKKEAVQAKKQLADAESRLQTLTSQFEELRSKASSARQKVDEAKASLAADKSENAVLASLNKLKAQGRIKGFHGRLGDLGVIDEKYDVAVTTACGALNNLVVDTVEQGQACIEHLRKGNVGRASFMVLDKLPPRDLSRIETPEGVPRLFDLIKPKDPKFAPAFYKGVFNTLVADDLQQAQRIGYGKKRWRVVTLAGQLIDPSGTMSGGGTRVARGGMNSKFTADKVAPEVVHGYEKECHAAEEKLSSAQAEKRAAEQEVAQLRKRLPEIEIEMEKIELDIQTGSKRIGEAEKRLSELQSQSKPDLGDEKRIKTLDSEIASLTAEADKLRSKSSGINEQIKELQNKILEVGGVKLRAIQSKFANTKGLLDLASEAITKAEVGQAKSIRDAEKLEKAIQANTAKAEEAQGELDVVEGDLQACSADLAIIREKVQEAQDASIDVQEALAQSKADLDEASTEVNAFRKLEMDIKQKIEDNGRVQKDSKDKYRHWSKRHEELELAYIDEEEEDDEEAAKPADADNAAEAADGDAEADDAEPKQKKSKHDSLELVEYSPDELRGVDKDILTAEITALEEETAKAKPNLNVLHEYRRREAEFLERARDLEAVTSQRDAAKQRYDDLRKVRLDEFMAGFSAISSKLKEMYQMITMGGNAEIELVDTMDPFSEGVVLSIMPPKKSWRPIANLSGGEKTLASLALVFALHVFKPTPLYFMDEIDAALDFKNVSIVANYIQSKTQAAQFIVISLRNDMFELAHRLVGIYKTSNCTKSIAIDNKDLRTQAVVGKPTKRLPPATGAPSTEVPPTPKLAVPSTPTPASARTPSAPALA
ncbi:Structural maintenance of chromosomes protein 4 [Vanrija albida]|uniref:Structural maintenance of chromosomes protein n=1 Tax=Vanrija albida TaxID=181172 RepID=A0ABR3Q0M6_9TREE